MHSDLSLNRSHQFNRDEHHPDDESEKDKHISL